MARFPKIDKSRVAVSVRVLIRHHIGEILYGPRPHDGPEPMPSSSQGHQSKMHLPKRFGWENAWKAGHCP